MLLYKQVRKYLSHLKILMWILDLTTTPKLSSKQEWNFAFASSKYNHFCRKILTLTSDQSGMRRLPAKCYNHKYFSSAVEIFSAHAIEIILAAAILGKSRNCFKMKNHDNAILLALLTVIPHDL